MDKSIIKKVLKFPGVWNLLDVENIENNKLPQT